MIKEVRTIKTYKNNRFSIPILATYKKVKKTKSCQEETIIKEYFVYETDIYTLEEKGWDVILSELKAKALETVLKNDEIRDIEFLC